ncbi:MAG: aldo/keto reductase [Candidatus Thermoplasmatota archaeon]
MEYNKFGDEGKKISELGMGCYALSGVYGEVDKRKFQATLDHAESLGINYFDTAETYGEEAERILGEVIKPYRDDIILSTKIGASPENEKPPLSRENVKASCERSLERLQTDNIDIYFVHFDDPKTEVSETVEALDELKEEGKIRHYGVSHLPVKRIEEYLKEGDVSFCMMELSAAARESRKKLLPLCREHGAEAIAFSVTGRGILTGRFDGSETFEKNDLRNMDPLFKKERFRSSLRVTEKLEEIGEKYEKTPVQVAINWVLSQEGVISALTGTSSKDHLEENAGGTGCRLEKSDLDELESFLEKEDEVLERRENEIIEEVLNTEPSNGLEEAFNDLVYVMEVSGSRGIVDESEIEPIFRKLFSLRKKGELDRAKIKETHERLKEVIDPNSI